MSIVVSDVSYRYLNRQPLFEHIGFSVPVNGKVSLIGHNGSGKSTLLKLLAGEFAPSSGSVRCASKPYYIPQQTSLTGQSVAEAIGVAEKINALYAIYGGSSDQLYYDLLADDWEIESKCRSALDHWGLVHVKPETPVDMLSGGESTKVFLAGMSIHRPEIILLDEPTNHLDLSGRRKLYDYIDACRATVVVVSHDVTLLNRMETTYELSGGSLKLYGGNYEFYEKQKETEENALSQRIDSEEAALRKARKKAREVRERQEKRIHRSEKTVSGIPRIILNARHDKGENTGARLSEKHTEIIAASQQKLTGLRQRQQKNIELKVDFEDARMHNGKLLAATVDMNFGYDAKNMIWRQPLNVEVRSGERIHIKGGNGTGKTTFIKLLTGELEPDRGEVRLSDFSYVYLDQRYGQTHRQATVLELAQSHNVHNLPDHEVKLRLNRALFPKETWDKSCLVLSGGERMRLYLCCLMISNHVPDMFILDEPANNLDLASLVILTNTIKNYSGTLMVVSHDIHFIEEVGITKCIDLDWPPTH